MKIVIAPDSFKGTMKSNEVCGIIARAARDVFDGVDIIEIPMSDGGEGMVEAYIKSKGGRKIYRFVTGPNENTVNACYAVTDGGKTAVIELAAASGLTLASEPKVPMRATTYGTGELIRHAASLGVKKILLGIGGSATMDGGAGIADALGFLMTDSSGNKIHPSPCGIGGINGISFENVPENIKNIEFYIACDVKNPLCGRNGAARVFGRQKGASEDEIALCDKNLRHYSDVLSGYTGKALASIPGSGAAGGAALPLIAFFDAKLTPGAELMLSVSEFDKKVKDADLVVTGEGRLDSQSNLGKAPVSVAKRAKQFGIPVIAIAGDISDVGFDAGSIGINAVFSINSRAVPFREAKKTCREDLYKTAENIFKLVNISRKKLI